MGIKRQPKSGIVNPFPGKKNTSVSAFRLPLVFQVVFCCFTEHTGAARFLTAFSFCLLLVFVIVGLCAHSIATIVYPPLLFPTFLPFLLSFLLLFLQYGGRPPEKYFY